jgi:hypothetical protein
MGSFGDFFARLSARFSAKVLAGFFLASRVVERSLVMMVSGWFGAAAVRW